MTESNSSRYQRLFEVWLLHHYWLDDGAIIFDQIVDQGTRDARLLTYDSRPFLAVVPTATSQKNLSAYGCLFRQTALGFLVAAPDTAVIPTDTVFEFVVSTQDAQLYNYTSLTYRPNRIYELFNSADGLIHRYKENVPRLSNSSGTTRGTAPDISLFLSQEIPAQTPDDLIESLVLSGGALLQLTGDSPAPTTQQLAAQATALPVFVNQGDAPVIVPPAGLVGAPARGVTLSSDVTDDVFVLISLTAVRGDNDAFSFVDGAGAPKAAPPVYQVRFRNRSTTWTYLDKSTGAVDSTEPDPLPLTFFGNAGTKQKPSRGFVKAQTSGTRITGLISEIYI